MRAKGNAFFGHFAQLVQAENLEAAGIGKDRPGQSHKTMQAPKLTHDFDSRTQVEVISVAEENLDAKLFENVLGHGFDSPSRAYRHEHRSFDLAVRRVQATAASFAGAGLDLELHGQLVFTDSLAIVATVQKAHERDRDVATPKILLVQNWPFSSWDASYY